MLDSNTGVEVVVIYKIALSASTDPSAGPISEEEPSASYNQRRPPLGPVLPAVTGPALAACALGAGSLGAHVTDVKGSGEAVVNVLLPSTLFSTMGLMVERRWSGEERLWTTDLYRTDDGTLCVTRCLDPVGPFTGPVGSSPARCVCVPCCHTTFP